MRTSGDGGEERNGPDFETQPGLSALNGGEESDALNIEEKMLLQQNNVTLEEKDPSGKGCEPDEEAASMKSLEEEFGKVEVHHLKTRAHVNYDSSLGQKLSAIVARRRHIGQFFCNDVLYRGKKKRKVADDELFMDLVIVACIAEFGHELRDQFDGWGSIEKFFLLFQLVWFVWRNAAFAINIFPLETDLFLKVSMFCIMAMLIIIGLSAHTSFTSTIGWTSWTAFAGIFLFGLIQMMLGGQSTKLNSKNPLKNSIILNGLFSLITSFPYMVAAIVDEPRTAKNMFWIYAALQIGYSLSIPGLYKVLRSRMKVKVTPAINIEAFTEKFGLITLITIGEGFIALLFEAAGVSSPERALMIVLVGVLGLVISYSIMTLYFDVDNKMLAHEVHAIRKDSRRGVAWSGMHLFYHASIVLGATGLGEALQAAAESIPKAKSERLLEEVGTAVLRAGEVKVAVFDQKWRWLFCAGYGVAVVSSGFLSAMHGGGPYSITKWYRLAARVVLAIATVFTSIPLSSSLTPQGVVGATAAVIGVMGIVEFVLVLCDRLHVWPWVDYNKIKQSLAADGDDLLSISTSGEDHASDSLFSSLKYSGQSLRKVDAPAPEPN